MQHEQQLQLPGRCHIPAGTVPVGHWSTSAPAYRPDPLRRVWVPETILSLHVQICDEIGLCNTNSPRFARSTPRLGKGVKVWQKPKCSERSLQSWRVSL